MADALITVVIEKLSSVIQQEVEQEIRLVVGVRGEVDALTTILRNIHGVTRDAEKRQINEESVKLWLDDLKHAAYDIEDVLDDWCTSILIQGGLAPSNDHKVLSLPHKLFSCFRQVALRHDIGSKIKDLRRALDEINSRRRDYSLNRENPIFTEHPIHGPSRKVISSLERQLFGRGLDKDIIVNMLLGETIRNQQEDPNKTVPLNDSNTNPLFISIVGMGGLGKTTLAQLAFNDPEVETQFDKTKIWFCVSHPFEFEKLAEVIIRKLGGAMPSTKEWEDFHQCLCESLRGKRFLLVLDDVWPQYDQRKWDSLKISLKCGEKGSRVLVTTRTETVASRMDNKTYIHKMGVLSDDDCSSLLCHIALGERSDTEEVEVLGKIGRQIAKKCKGLPLAAMFLGGLLSEKRTPNEWKSVLESEIWKLEQQEGNDAKYFLIPSLLLSYSHLDSPIKRCFTYCVIFPKDAEIKRNELIKLWMAHGLLTPKENEMNDLESVGDKYFKNLMVRSFFQDFVKDNEGNVVSCKMHDLVHDFASYLTENEYILNTNWRQLSVDHTSARKVRHLTLICEDEVNSSSLYSSIYRAKSIRTLQLVMAGWHSNLSEVPSDLFHHLRCLRVLYMKNIRLESLPSEIEKLIHLRYLNLSQNPFTDLPDSICNLYNLQTLNLENCGILSQLPKGMNQLINLRHLEIQSTSNLNYLPKGIGELTNLRTLDKFTVGWSGSEGCHITELKNLHLLRGYLRINGLERVLVEESLGGELVEKQHLHALEFDFELIEGKNTESMEDVFQGLQPSRNLKKLYVNNYLGRKLPTWMKDKVALYHLCSLQLSYCMNCVELPALGQLCSLKVLRIYRMYELKKIGVEFLGFDDSRGSKVAFPKLTELFILDVDELEEWDLGTFDNRKIIMPCLRQIHISCKNLKALPSLGKLPALEDLKVLNMYQVKHIGFEFYGFDKCVNGITIAFPKLKNVYFSEMHSLEKWDIGLEHDGREIVIMPCLSHLSLYHIRKLKVLPSFGNLPSLESLEITVAQEVERIGLEFYGNIQGTRCDKVAFPKLKNLNFSSMYKLKEWDLPEVEDLAKTIMPCLQSVTLEFSKLMTLSFLGKLQCIETLKIVGFEEVRHIDYEFYGVNNISVGTVFPKLKKLTFITMDNLEELELRTEEQQQLMPCISTIKLENCPKLRILPSHIPQTIRKLKFLDCPLIEELQLSWGSNSPSSSLITHPLIEELRLSGDNGVFSRSLSFFPNLKSLSISYPPEKVTFLQGLSEQRELQYLRLHKCTSLQCLPEEIQDLHRLQELSIEDCDIIEPRCVKEGEDWNIISHIPNIFINKNRIQ